METTIKHAQSELLELAIKFRTDLPRIGLDELPTAYQAQLIGAAIVDDPDRFAELLEDVSSYHRKGIGHIIMTCDGALAMTVLIQQFKESPYFRDILLDIQIKADAAIEQSRLANSVPEPTIVDRMGDTVSFK